MMEHSINSKQKALLSQKLAEIDKRLTDGCDEHLQLLDLSVSFIQIMKIES
jgi:DNA polymerase III delta prime subunit